MVSVKRRRVPRNVSLYINGRWVFGSITQKSLVKTTPEAFYYKVNVPFGIVDNLEKDPAMTIGRGEAGDYLLVDVNNLLSIMSDKDYRKIFDIKNTSAPEQTTVNSNALKGKDFYKNVAKNRPQ